MEELFKKLMDQGLIEDSEDGDVLLSSKQPRIGWFVSPKARIIIENHLSDYKKSDASN